MNADKVLIFKNETNIYKAYISEFSNIAYIYRIDETNTYRFHLCISITNKNNDSYSDYLLKKISIYNKASALI